MSNHQIAVQALLKRHLGTTVAEFRASYERHAKLVMPWCLANGIPYYAQIHRPLHWASEEANSMYESKVNLEEWDAVAEMALPEAFDLVNSAGGAYYEKVILPDERRFLFDEATKHMMVVGSGSVAGSRIEFIVDGKPTLEYEEWQNVWKGYEEPSSAQHEGERPS